MLQVKSAIPAGLLLFLLSISGGGPRAQMPSSEKSGLRALQAASADSAARSKPDPAKPDPAVQGKVLQDYGKLPLSFEANQGQTDSQVKFLARGGGYTLFLTGDQAVLSLKKSEAEIRNSISSLGARHSPLAREERPRTKDAVLTMQLIGANANARVTGGDELPGKSNYFIGNDPKKWRTNVPNYARVRYECVYPGVDLVYYGNQGQLEYDFVVAPGSDPRAIQLGFGVRPLAAALPERSLLRGRTKRADLPEQPPATESGVKTLHSKALRAGRYSLRLAANGDLLVQTGSGEVRFHKPTVYQPAADNRPQTAVEGGFRLVGHNKVTFEVAKYDRTRPLVIDPALSYSTFLGGSSGAIGYGIGVDASGGAYVTGYAYGADFPTTLGAYQTVFGGDGDVFVSKFSPSGSTLIYSTFVGGSASDAGYGIAVDTSGNAYVTGETGSTNFPTTPGAFQSSCGSACSNSNTDAFVTVLNSSGSALIYSTYLGGSNSNQGFKIAVDADGNACVTGDTDSTDFPITPGAFQSELKGEEDAFVSRFNSQGTALYSTYLGGSGQEIGRGVAVDAVGDAFLTGLTTSTDFPVSQGAFQTSSGGSADAYVTEMSPAGALVYSTYLGGPGYDEGYEVGVDQAGAAYVTGFGGTGFPTTPGAFQTTNNGGDTPFVSKISANGSTLTYSTYVGPGGYGYGIALDSSGNAYVTGSASGSGFPTSPGAFQLHFGGGQSDAFVTELNSVGSALIYSTYLGGTQTDQGNGVALDSAGSIYVTGNTGSLNFPSTPGAFDPTDATCNGCSDAFVTKFGAGDQVWPLSLALGNQTVGIASGPQTTTLSNSGTTTLTITSIGVSLNNGTFSQTNNCAGTLAPGASCTISLSWTPSVAGSMTGSITITDSAVNSPQIVSLSGTGVEPTPLLSPTSLIYPVQIVFTSSTPQSVTLSNTGLGVLAISKLAVASNFTQTNTCGSTVAPGASCTITVSFLPQNKGPLSGSLTVTDNAPGSPQSVPLSGTGTFMQLSPASINFGNQPVHTTSIPRKIAVSNKGFATVSITGIGVGGANRQDFGETNTCGSSLASGASCFITVAFTPGALGTRTAAVTILDNGGGSPQSVTLTGSGTP